MRVLLRINDVNLHLLVEFRINHNIHNNEKTIIGFSSPAHSCFNRKRPAEGAHLLCHTQGGVTVSNITGQLPVYVAYAVMPDVSGTEGTIFVPDSDPGKWGLISYENQKRKAGFTAGVEAQYQFTRLFGLSVGVFYTQQGAKYGTKGKRGTPNGEQFDFKDDLKVNLNSIATPVLANVYVWKGLALKAGLQPEFAVSRSTSGDFAISYKGKPATTSSGAFIKTFALSVPVGISYEYKNLVADLRYNFGVTNLRQDGDKWNRSYGPAAHNRSLTFTVGYKWGL